MNYPRLSDFGIRRISVSSLVPLRENCNRFTLGGYSFFGLPGAKR